MPKNKTPLLLLDVELNTGTERVSLREVNSPTITYEPFLISASVFESGVPSPAGLPITGDARFKLAESQARKFRDLFSHQTPRRRKVRLWTLFEGESLTYRQPDASPPELRTPFFTGEIVDAIFNADRSIDLVCRDTMYAWLDEPIPAMITKEIYPELESRYEGQFLSIIVGEVDTPPPNIQSPAASPPSASPQLRGQIPLRRMGWNDETGDRWGVAAHPCAKIDVFRKVEISVDGEETEIWEYVSPGEYEERIIAKTAFNVNMHHHVIDFFVEQPDGTECRADVHGIYYRGPWGGLPEVGTPLGSPPAGTTSPPAAALQNPIDFFINMTFFVMKKAGVSGGDGSVFDLVDIAALREKFELLGLKCDGAITEAKTCRQWLEQFLADFNLDMWQKRNGKISLNFTDEENPDRPVYDDGTMILKSTFVERTPEKPINQIQYRYLYNFAEQTFGTWGLLDTSEQEVLAVGEEPKVEKEILDMYHVRDPVTALIVAEHRSQFEALGSYTQEWELPLPEVPITLEPSSMVGITHPMGLEIGGYVNREAKVLKLRHDTDRMRTKVYTVLRVPQSISQSVWVGESYFEAIDLGISASLGTFQRSIFLLPRHGFTGAVEFFLEAVGTASVFDSVWTIYPYRGAGDIDTARGRDITIPLGFSGRVRNSKPFPLDTQTDYYIIQSPSTGTLNRLRIVAASQSSSAMVSEICLSNGDGATSLDQSIGGGDLFRTTSSGEPGDGMGFVSVGGPRWKYVMADWQNIVKIAYFVKLANASFDIENKYSEYALWDIDDDLPAIIGQAKDANMTLNPLPFLLEFDKAILTDGHTYETRIRCVKVMGGGDFNTYFHGSRLHVHLNKLEAFELHERIGNEAGVGEVRGRLGTGKIVTPTAQTDADVLYEFHDSSGTRSGISDYGTSDSETTGVEVPITEEEITDGTTLFARTQNVSQHLTHGNRYASGGILKASLIRRYPPVPAVFPYTPATPRQQYLADLFYAGYPAALAVLFEEGSGAPKEFFTDADLTVAGTPDWITDPTYGSAGRALAVTDHWTVDDCGLLVPTNRATLLVIRKKSDTAARNGNVAGLLTTFFTKWFDIQIPRADGTTYWGQGGGYLTYGGYSPATDLEAWAFRWGPTSGRAIQKDGTIVASEPGPGGTRAASGATDDFAINNASSDVSNGDLQSFFFVALIRAEVPDSVLSTFTLDRVLLGI